MNVDTARGIALMAHLGQAEKDGSPYIRHLERVAAAVPSGLEIAAYLHDSIEDCEALSIEDLASFGVCQADCQTIWTVTRKPDQVTYYDFITDVIESESWAAIELKLEDVEDHLRPGYELVLKPRKIEEYETARLRLRKALNRS